MDWFEEWFDSPLYERLYSDRDEAEAERLVDLIERCLPPERYPEVLDLACGRGRHSLSLANRGYRVTGVDLSVESIEKAKRLAEDREVDRVEFRVGDMRDSLDRRFDAVFNLFTSFGYFDRESENVDVIRNVNSMLREEGGFMIDFMNAPKVRTDFVPEEEGSFKGVRYRIRRFVRDEAIYKKIRFDGPGLSRPKTYTERVRLYDEEWFRNRLVENGFRVNRTFGDYNGGPYDRYESRRLVILAVKNRDID